MKEIPDAKKDKMATFLITLYEKCFLPAHFTYLEINPVVMTDTQIVPLDCAAKIDETAAFLCEPLWQGCDFPAPFGRAAYPEEKFIADMDAKTGASLKLTILNIHGNVWTMVAGGGASVVFADTVCDYGYGHELANYGGDLLVCQDAPRLDDPLQARWPKVSLRGWWHCELHRCECNLHWLGQSHW